MPPVRIAGVLYMAGRRGRWRVGMLAAAVAVMVMVVVVGVVFWLSGIMWPKMISYSSSLDGDLVKCRRTAVKETPPLPPPDSAKRIEPAIDSV